MTPWHHADSHELDDWGLYVPKDPEIWPHVDRLALEYGLRVHEIEDTEHLAEARSYSHANDLIEGRRLEGRPLMIATTAGNTPEAYRHGGGNLMPMTDLLAPLRMTAHRCGLVWAEPFVVYRADRLTQEELDATADDYCAALIRWTDTSARKAAWGMGGTHDTFTDPGAGTPLWFTLAARTLPIGIFIQFLSAALLLTASLTLLAKVERRRARHHPDRA